MSEEEQDEAARSSNATTDNQTCSSGTPQRMAAARPSTPKALKRKLPLPYCERKHSSLNPRVRKVSSVVIHELRERGRRRGAGGANRSAEVSEPIPVHVPRFGQARFISHRQPGVDRLDFEVERGEIVDARDGPKKGRCAAAPRALLAAEADDAAAAIPLWRRIAAATQVPQQVDERFMLL
ncbi:hypothetical protein ACHAXT_010823, partial [Thalassiosira profunda]